MRVRLTAETKPLRTLAKPRRVSGPRFPGQFLHDLEASIGKRNKPGFAVPRVTLCSSLVRDSSSPDRVNVQNACDPNNLEPRRTVRCRREDTTERLRLFLGRSSQQDRHLRGQQSVMSYAGGDVYCT